MTILLLCFFNDFGTVIVLVQVLPNIISLSAAWILTFLWRYGLRFEPVEKNKIFRYRCWVGFWKLFISISNKLISGSCSSIYTKTDSKTVGFSVYTPEPETVLIRGKADSLRVFIYLLVHEKWFLALSNFSLSS